MVHLGSGGKSSRWSGRAFLGIEPRRPAAETLHGDRPSTRDNTRVTVSAGEASSVTTDGTTFRIVRRVMTAYPDGRVVFYPENTLIVTRS
jgi:hypothetical protein